MKTDELIERIGRRPPVVRPFASPARRAMGWTLWAVVYFASAITMALATAPGTVVDSRPLFLVQQLVALVAGVAAARAALSSVVPGSSTRAFVVAIVALSAWTTSLVMQAGIQAAKLGFAAVSGATDWPCVVTMVAGGVFLGAPLAWTLRRGWPLMPRLTMGLVAVASLSIANVEACLLKVHPFASTVLLWHGGTLLVSIVLLSQLGGYWLRAPKAV